MAGGQSQPPEMPRVLADIFLSRKPLTPASLLYFDAQNEKKKKSDLKNKTNKQQQASLNSLF